MSDEKLSLTEQEKSVWRFYVASQGQPPIFRPFAKYRKDLDQIVVQTRGCSVTEISVGKMLTLMEANYSGTEEDVPAGFIIECAHTYCLQQGLLKDGKVNLLEVVESFVREPCCYRESDVAIALDVLSELRITHLRIVI